MPEIRIDKTIAAPIGRAFELLADHAGYARFRPIGSARLVREGEPAPNGLGALRALTSGPLKFEEEITAYEPPTRLGYLIRKVNIPLEHEGGTITLEELGERSTRIHWVSSFRTPIPLVGGVFGAGLAAALRRGFIQVLEDVERLA